MSYVSFLRFLALVLGLCVRHMQVSRLGVKMELQLPVYATGTAMLDPSHVCNLYHNSRQHQIHNLLREARDPTCGLMDASQIRFH